MIIVVTIIFFFFGLIIGSFLNVVIARLNTERSFGGRSACMSCQNTLCWYELVPLASFFVLGGRCRTCKTRISISYPLVELATGLIFAALFLKFSALGGQFSFFTPAFIIAYAYYAAIFALLVVIAVYDLRHKIIPDSLAFALGALGFIGLFFFNNSGLSSASAGWAQAGFYPHMPSILEFLSGFLIALPFYLFWPWMGLGDAKLAVGLGWLLGLARAFSGLVVAFWLGAIVGLSLVVFSKKYGIKSEIPFAPYLVLGALLAFLFELRLF
ncbi:MAG: Type 4 prepilin-like protein leader peptide-processing enzyme PilD [Candidatus Nomurabacteria bacterium GW2011_GWC2_41_8]|uniref:Type 4 prepilin-like protein leader peptide-processing enzyme PilD n=1 Tax=Candidatus Nomurabacteria bacterium GW2011_GWC2_41_8 TaxID=1618755 RepID=A0A0G1AF50_9BACT|nr:MAG: Type 4 prepilin-like protein leader peptide-processing enzyme PilD [Candidatus Nomurabacteria bacterium GW2011_GWC2_41_8]